MKLAYLPVILYTLQVLEAKKEGVTRIITVGDSITRGDHSSDPLSKSYPSQLMNMLNNKSKYEVINFGVDGKTMMKTGAGPYWNEQAYKDALNSEADIVIMMFGTNDSRINQWNSTEFHDDYIEMI
jgi:lysophospholipase L1-like esterase